MKLLSVALTLAIILGMCESTEASKALKDLLEQQHLIYGRSKITPSMNSLLFGKRSQAENFRDMKRQLNTYLENMDALINDDESQV
ncbi:uncharacterized protein LOC131929896 [Physella acuta]|uniref:uncharacterized protein LOC131929896 n=1 Tax=Physella acuta TaxID=109671 RepID=UPI0027DE8D67|nr:uncharacterized protein LOC131929896 [Physella acuta]